MMRMPTNKWKDEPLTKEMVKGLHNSIRKQREKDRKTKRVNQIKQ